MTTEWLKKKRAGVLVDHRQNGHGKTIASVYSVRPKPGAPVSTPLRWEELTEDVRPRDFTMAGRAAARRRARRPVRARAAWRPGARAGVEDAAVIAETDWVAVSGSRPRLRRSCSRWQRSPRCVRPIVRRAPRSDRCWPGCGRCWRRPGWRTRRRRSASWTTSGFRSQAAAVSSMSGTRRSTSRSPCATSAPASRCCTAGISSTRGTRVRRASAARGIPAALTRPLHRSRRDRVLAGRVPRPGGGSIRRSALGGPGAAPLRPRRALRRPRARAAVDHALLDGAARRRPLDRDRLTTLERRPPRPALTKLASDDLEVRAPDILGHRRQYVVPDRRERSRSAAPPARAGP